jgi:hypothetical protein
MKRNEKLHGWGAMKGPRLLGRHLLANGLTLEFWDHSRPLVGDRWFVRLEARIAVGVRAESLPPELQGAAGAVVEALGEEITFSHVEERNFIARLFRARRVWGWVHPEKVCRTPGTAAVAGFGYEGGRRRLRGPCPARAGLGLRVRSA